MPLYTQLKVTFQKTLAKNGMCDIYATDPPSGN